MKATNGALGATSRPVSPEHSLRSQMTQNFTMLSPKRTAKGFMMPREGPEPGGGLMQVFDRMFVEANRHELEHEDQATMTKRRKDRPSTVPAGPGHNSSVRSLRESRRHLQSAEASTGSLGDTSPSSHSGFLDARARAKLSPEERRGAEIAAKWKKVEDVRDRDAIIIRDKVERRKDERDARLKRLLTTVTGTGIAYDTAMELRHYDAESERKNRNRYLEWDEKIFKPAASKAYDHMNVKRETQQWIAGRKSVAFQLPSEPFRLPVDVSQDPSRKHLYEDVKEKAFHEAAEALLGRSHSEPDIRYNIIALQERGGVKSVMPKALSRPVLDPNSWSQKEIQGSVFGRFSQACEAGKDGRRLRRGGPNVFVPKESDGVMTAGTKISRVHGFRDVGVLRDDCAWRGESFDYNNGVGASSGAPAQDHYTYDHGREVADLEFPLGKRIVEGVDRKSVV